MELNTVENASSNGTNHVDPVTAIVVAERIEVVAVPPNEELVAADDVPQERPLYNREEIKAIHGKALTKALTKHYGARIEAAHKEFYDDRAKRQELARALAHEEVKRLTGKK